MSCSLLIISLGRRLRSGIWGASFSRCSSKRSIQNGSQPAAHSMKPTLSFGKRSNTPSPIMCIMAIISSKGKAVNVDIGIFEKTRAACRHHTEDSGNSFVAGLWMNAQSHADLLRGIIDREEHRVAHISAVDIGRQHGGDRAGLGKE